jgi:hypothetical protein
MMAKHPSFGSKIMVDIAGGSDYASVGQVLDIAGPNISRSEIDTTDHDNAEANGGDGYREFLGGIPDGGDITFPVHFDPINLDTHGQTAGSGILSTFTKQDLVSWKISLNVLNGTLNWECDGFLNSWSPESPLEGKHTGEVSIKVSGKPLLTATS